tara:strand:- start:2126 stop:2647 length:522 start_codon:yes stop_codon:yes gene_type:complete
MSMTQKLWTVSSLSVEFGMDRRTVAQRLNGVEPIEVKGRVKKYSMHDAAKAIIGQVNTTEGILSYDEARARKMAAEAELSEIELQKERAQVLPIDVVNMINNEVFGNFRAKLLALPARAAPDVFASSDVKEAKAILRKNINGVLEELSNMLVETYDFEDTEFTGGEEDDSDNT